MRLMKPLEDRLPLLRRNAHTLIGDGQPDAALVVVPQSDRHAATVGTELDGIVQQVGQDLLKPHRIDHGLELCRALKDKGVVGIVMVWRERRVDQWDEIGADRLNAQHAGLVLRRIEQAHHQLVQLSGLPVNRLQSGRQTLRRDLALAAHIAADVITSYGTMVFAPFSDWRAAIGTTFIIDLWFSGIILAGLIASALLYRSRIPAIVSIAMLMGYVAFQFLLKLDAQQFGESYARARGLSTAIVKVHPRPVSPFNWTVFVSDDDAHRFAHINLVRKEAKSYRPGDGFIAMLDSVYEPLSAAHWETRTRYGVGDNKTLAQDAWNSPAMAVYRWFADLPAFDGISAGSTCVWFIDLRFYTPGRATQPFRYGACRDAPEAAWRLVPP